MTHVATLVCDPRRPILTDECVRLARGAAPSPLETRWLDPGVAVDICFAADASADLKTVEQAMRRTLAGAAIDIIVQPKQGRRKKLLTADMDSTMIGQECIDELAAEIGKRDHVAAITERAMRGEIAFEAALRERVALLKGLHRDAIDRVIETRLTLTPGARTLIGAMRRHGAHTALVSGGFTAFTGAIAEAIGFEAHFANRLEIDSNDFFTGRLIEPIFGADAKLATLRRLCAAYGLDASEAIAVGDGANDLPMLREAGLGVAFRGKPLVAAAADVRIDHADLTALLYAQGFSREEFAGDGGRAAAGGR
ncbi:phosphoserine phosphatase SerB [Methylocella silvestris BL2]|uniref:Phosphoserine phosphatase n=1 Tax=Methylocella silvestris (strain DSM 15510 / CIP 108128 / LMG 27833 / NCIMB 13906 / BL2) TaxID=395965 RepID=B8ELS1_METSB|nr:phosphoserine phosphatase SerB [Methylocella silvestris]ACK50702.1 phosphoserine phosphatase SerB [Methylocella silvestris BL2]